MRLAQATWDLNGQRHRALVAPHPGDLSRVVDLRAVEAVRLAKLGEGEPLRLAEALVPSALEPVLRGGPRALQRLGQTLRYALKWEQRSGLPEALAPRLADIRLRPCLPRPASLRRYDGTPLDARMVGGPEASLSHPPAPTLALVGMHPGRLAGVCLALEDAPGVVLGGWLALGPVPEGGVALRLGTAVRTFDGALWQGLELPALGPCEVVLLPAPIQPPLEGLRPGLRFHVEAAFERLTVRLGRAAVHPILQ